MPESKHFDGDKVITQEFDYDVIAIGAGFAGLSLIHQIRTLGLSIRVFDKASDIGGTWAWNHYPGAATDSESYVYCLTFSEELLQEWTWSERYPGWEETQRYFHFVADKFGMKDNIQLNTEIVSADYQEGNGSWLIRSATGEAFTCKYFISAMGLMSQPVMPDIKGQENFAGPIFHSSRWPEEGLDYAGKKVGIIGAGATAVQMLPVMAETAANVTIFQRTPNFVLPAVQKPITEEWEKDIKANYSAILEKCRGHVFGLPYNSPVNRTIADTAPEE
ncbi:MAG: NAD(P)/FAD-dependent oxidoreductase, partial [Pseudomonadota bacterium]